MAKIVQMSDMAKKRTKFFSMSCPSAADPRPKVRVSNERHGKETNEVFSMSCPSAARSARRFFQYIYGWLLLRLDRFGIIAFIQVSVVYRTDFQSGSRAAYMSG